MRIADSTVNMSAARNYTQAGLRAGNGSGGGFLQGMVDTYNAKQGGAGSGLLAYGEKEETGFQANGTVRTEDGRTIDFDVELQMSRSYMEYIQFSQVNMLSLGDPLCDPLIVNIGGETADVSDKTFMFDLDADGTEDKISTLGKGSGFLALDKDGNGKIDDGSELFGAKSGDGFGDLREYDSDGNGWIDENDEVFSRLKVWRKDENGNDSLMDLKQADIGAIYLGAQQTEFTLGGADGYRDGVIRSTGVFLRESTGAGTVQHVDLSLKQNGQGMKVSGEDVDEAFTVSNISNNSERQSNAARRNAERRRQDAARIRKKKAADKAAAEAAHKKQMQRREQLEKLRKNQSAERQGYYESIRGVQNLAQQVSVLI